MAARKPLEMNRGLALMANFIITEEALHYAAAFLERWQDKNPSKHHNEIAKEFRDLSNFLLEHLNTSTSVGVIRKYTKGKNETIK